MTNLTLSLSGFNNASRLRIENERMQSAVGRLSSGKRIQKSGDDVAGLSVSTNITTRVTALRSVINNLAQAGSLLEVADGVLARTDEKLQRMSQLAVMANGGAITDTERAMLNLEFENLSKDINRSLGEARFNSVSLFGISQLTETEEAPPPPPTYRDLRDLASLDSGTYQIQSGGTSFDGYVDNDGENSWLLVGRGREGWEFDEDGQGNIESVISGLGTKEAFAPAAYSSDVINGLLQQSGVSLDDVEIRIKRASNTTGTAYQEVRWRPIPSTGNSPLEWSWRFDQLNYDLEHEVRASNLGAAFTDTTSRSRDTNNTPGSDSGNNYRRVFTFAWGSHGNQKGFSYGTPVQGVNGNNPDTFLWERTTENNAVPYTEVYIRLKNPEIPKPPETDLFIDPRNIDGLVTWLDGSDLDGDGIMEGAAEAGRVGTNARYWQDKSASGMVVRAANMGSTPQFTTTLNGMDVVRLANNRQAIGTDVFGGSASEMTVFYVTQAAVRTNNGFLSFNGTGTGNPGTPPSATNRAQISGPRADGSWRWEAGNTTSNLARVTGNITAANTPVIVTAYKSVSENQNGLLINGGVVSDSSAAANPFTTTGGLRLGRGSNSQDLAELVVFDRALSVEERARVEGYLAQKWGLQGSLAGFHAYQGASPLQGVELSIGENAQKGALVGSASIGDISGLTYEINSGDAKGLFNIDASTGQISLAKSEGLDYETRQEYMLNVRVTGDVLGSAPMYVPVTIHVTDAAETLNFQVAAKSEHQLAVELPTLNTAILFGGDSLSINTQQEAAHSFERIAEAIDRITATRADIGAKRSSVDILSNVVEVRIRNQEFANAAISDTNIAQQSTNFAQSMVRVNLNIAVQVQANNLMQDVLRLVEA